jgi:hypothetical protein
LKSTLALKVLDREGSERDGIVRPDGTSSAAFVHGIPNPDQELPKGSPSEMRKNTNVPLQVRKDTNYSSFSDLGSYASVAMAELVEGHVLTRLDKFLPAPSVFTKNPWLSDVRSCSLGIV